MMRPNTYFQHTIQTLRTPQLVAIEQLLKSTKACWYIRFLNVMAKNHIENILPFVIYTMYNCQYTYILSVLLCTCMVFFLNVKDSLHTFIVFIGLKRSSQSMKAVNISSILTRTKYLTCNMYA